MSAVHAPSGVSVPASGPDLRDIHLPAEPSWWPPAPGWWVLVLIFLGAVLAMAWYWRRQRRKRQQQRGILLELDRLVEQHRQDGDQAALIGGMHQLLRRMARRHDALATQQRGDIWRQTLARVPVDAATLERLLALDELIYRPPTAFDEAASIAAVRCWLQIAVNPARWKAAALESSDA
ncbi:MAG TPA: DUF4381 domain-containing protein [Rhodanobacter sp.]|nr:DUF4381 domain-containing protein [Rhodanobacter sp.]